MSAFLQRLPRHVHPQEVAFGHEALRLNETIAKNVIEVLARWSHIDTQLINVVSGLLEADFHVTLAMLGAITSSTGRHAAINAAAEAKFKDAPESLKIFQAVESFVDEGKAIRNAYAHWLWGWSDKIKHKLVLVNPAAIHAVGADLAAMLAGKMPIAHIDGIVGIAGIPVVDLKMDRSHFWVVSEADTTRHINDAEQIRQLLSDLGQTLLYPKVLPEKAAQARARLLANSRIWGDGKSQRPATNTPPSPPRLPPADPPPPPSAS